MKLSEKEIADTEFSGGPVILYADNAEREWQSLFLMNLIVVRGISAGGDIQFALFDGQLWKNTTDESFVQMSHHKIKEALIF